MASKPETIPDSQIHETLYRNILMLTRLYPAPNKELLEVLRKDMFVKNNRAAFIQVIYYLLYTINPEELPNKIISWPVFDPQYERKFRTEVMNYLNKLNEIYPDANMPSIMASQLLSPGGVKFAKYMLKLSILVMNICLQRNKNVSRTLLLKPRLCKNGENVKPQIKRLKIITNSINNETVKMNEDFLMELNKCRDRATIISEKINKIQSDIETLEQELKTVQSADRKDDIPNIKENIEMLQEKLAKVKTYRVKLAEIANLMSQLTKGNLNLEHSGKHELDLITSLGNFTSKMTDQCFKMVSFSDIELDTKIEKFKKTIEGLSQLKEDWIQVHQDCEKELVNLKAAPTIAYEALSSIDEKSQDSTALAVPLEE